MLDATDVAVNGSNCCQRELVQVFEGFRTAVRYVRWRIDHTGGNQPWVKEVQFRRAKI